MLLLVGSIPLLQNDGSVVQQAGYCHFASDVWRPHPIYSSISIRMTQLRSERSLAGAVTAKVNRGEYMALHFIQSNVS